MKALFSRGFVAGARVQDDPCEGETRPTKSKMSKVPSLLFDIEVCLFNSLLVSAHVLCALS